jgi:tripartite-type tricarboxylate transporter receptor subunit TctC
VIQITGVTFGIVVPAESELRSFADLLAWGRQHPGLLTVGSTGVGSTAHLAMEDVLSREGVSYIHVPYKGTADQMLAVAGKTLMVGVNSTGFAPYVDNGKLRLLADLQRAAQQALAAGAHAARAGPSRRRSTPRPTASACRRRTDPAIVRKLHDAFPGRAVRPLSTCRKLAKYDQEPEYLDTADYGRFVQESDGARAPAARPASAAGSAR